MKKSIVQMRPVAQFGPATSVPVFTAKGNTIVSNMEAEAQLYGGLAALVAAFKSDLASLTTLESKATGPTGSIVDTNNRDAGHEKAFASEETLRLSLQLLVDAAPTPAAKLNLVVKSGYDVKKTRTIKPKTFGVDNAPATGSVRADVPAPARRYSIEWAASADEGKTWVIVASGPDAFYVYENLTVGVNYWFRYRVTLPKKKAGTWSDVLKLTVK